MCFTYYETCEAWDSRYQRARKSHKCHSCSRGIVGGSVYLAISGIFDGDPFSSKVCARCVLQREKIHEHEIAEGCHEDESWIVHEEVSDYMRESGMEWCDESEATAFCESAYLQQNAERKLRKPERLSLEKGGA